MKRSMQTTRAITLTTALLSTLLASCGGPQPGSTPTEDEAGRPIALTWVKSFGGDDNDQVDWIVPAPDGSFFMGGQTQSLGEGGGDAWVLRMDGLGDVTWSATYGSGREVVVSQDAFAIRKTSDGGYVAAGLLVREDSPFRAWDDIWVQKLDPDGCVQWQRIHTGGRTSDSRGTDMNVTADGGLVFITSEEDQIRVFRVDSAGNMLWDRMFGPNEEWDIGFAVQQTDDNGNGTADDGFIVVGRLGTANFTGGQDAWVLKLDPDGELEWERRIGGDRDAVFSSVMQTRDGGFACAGTLHEPHNPDPHDVIHDALIVKLDATGATQWQTTHRINRSHYGAGIDHTPDGGYIVAGYMDYRPSLLRLSQLGTVLPGWPKSYGDGERGEFEALSVTPRGDLLAAGVYDDAGPFIVRMDLDGNVSPGWPQVFGDRRGSHGHATSTDVRSLALADDEGCVIAGTADWCIGPCAWDTERWHPEILKVDADGRMQWRLPPVADTGRPRTLPFTDHSAAAVPSPDGGLFLAGHTVSFGAGQKDAWALLLDSRGDPIWQTTVGTRQDDWIDAADSSLEGGLVLAGSTELDPAGTGTDSERGFWVVNLSPDGEVLWQESYGADTGMSHATSIRTVPGDGYVVAGYAHGASRFTTDAALLRLDADGDVRWAYTYGGFADDKAESVLPTTDGGFVLAGRAQSFEDYDGDAWLLRLDADGQVLWQRAFGGAARDSVHSVAETSDGGFVLAGISKSFLAIPEHDPYLDDGDLWVFKVDGSGEVVWENTYGGRGEDSAYTVRTTDDGGYVVGGITRSIHVTATESWGVNKTDAWVLKLDAEGNVGSTCPSSIGAPSNAQVTDTDVEPTPLNLTASSVAATAYSAITTVTGRTVTDDIVVTRQCAGTSITAHFLTVDTEGEGIVLSNPAGIECGADGPCRELFTTGSTVALSPLPADGWDFVAWGGDCDEDGTLVMDRDTGCTATFAPLDDEPVDVAGDEGEEIVEEDDEVDEDEAPEDGGEGEGEDEDEGEEDEPPPPSPEYTLTVEVEGSGTVHIDPPETDCRDLCDHTYDANTIVMLTEQADAGWLFVEWQGDPDCGTGSVEINADKSCLARFVIQPGGGGGGGAPPLPQCGNSAIEAGEDCDDAGESAICDADCTLVECGDGTLNETAGEECDDGGTADGDGCAADCTIEGGEPECGNGTPETGEECDDGNEDNTDACLDICEDAECGDGFIWAGVEACDDAGESAACDADCTPAECGDGTLNETAGEECDDGGTADGDGCSSTCTIEGGSEVVLSDETFDPADWAASVFVSGGGADHGAEQIAAGGNPGQYRRMYHDLPANSYTTVRHTYLGGSYSPSVDGAIIGIDYAEDRALIDPGISDLNAAFILMQNGNTWVFVLDDVAGWGWTTVEQTDLTPGDFTFSSGPGPGGPPDFSAAGSEITFGYQRTNANYVIPEQAEVPVHGIDNWTVTIHRTGP